MVACLRHGTPADMRCPVCGVEVCSLCGVSAVPHPQAARYCPACLHHKVRSGLDFLEILRRPVRVRHAWGEAPDREATGAQVLEERARRSLVVGDFFAAGDTYVDLLDTWQRSYVLRGLDPDARRGLHGRRVAVRGRPGALLALPRRAGHPRQFLRAIDVDALEPVPAGASASFEDALTDLTTLEDLQRERPDDARLLARYGYLCFKAARTGSMARAELLERASAALERASALRPDWALAWHDRALVAAEQGRFDEALSLCREALARHPRYGSACLGLYVVHRERGELAAARAALERLLELGREPVTREAARLLLGRPAGLSPLTCLIACAPAALEAKYGPAGRARVQEALEELAAAQRAAGLVARVCALDGRDAGTLKARLDALCDGARRHGDPAEYVLLAGGPEIFPFFTLPDPTAAGATLLSDNPYASEAPAGAPLLDWLMPTRRLARLLDAPGACDPAFLVAQARQAVAFHAAPPPAAERVFAYTAQAWQQASREVLSTFPADRVELRVSEPLRLDDFSADWLAQTPCLHFNLHGSPHDGAWKGTGTPSFKLRRALEPARLAGARVAGAVVFAQCCWGADAQAHGRMAQAFLERGVRGFVGALDVAYGVDGTTALEESDLIAHAFWSHVRRGRRLGDALLRAREAFDDEMTRRQGGLDADDQKTLLTFVLYGDPTLRLEAAP